MANLKCLHLRINIDSLLLAQEIYVVTPVLFIINTKQFCYTKCGGMQRTVIVRKISPHHNMRLQPSEHGCETPVDVDLADDNPQVGEGEDLLAALGRLV